MLGPCFIHFNDSEINRTCNIVVNGYNGIFWYIEIWDQLKTYGLFWVWAVCLICDGMNKVFEVKIFRNCCTCFKYINLLGGPPLVWPPLEPGLCVSLSACRHLTWTHHISVPSWWNWTKLIGNIPWVVVHLFQIVLNFLYVCQSVSWLISLLK